MRIFLLSLTILFISSSFAQKITIKDDVAIVDGDPYLHYERRNMNNEASVRGWNADNEEMYIMFRDYIDPSRVSNSNPEGKVRWVEFNFVGLGKICEVESRTHKGLVKIIYDNKVFKDGTLDPDAVDRIVQKYGTSYSDNRPVNVILHHH